ncbi:MAG: LPS assembly lipoprotein LptE [Desulfobulbales bacterium]|nr:LPS assembly lipoprotein LptE [Desulfobulbales bacterium]
MKKIATLLSRIFIVVLLVQGCGYHNPYLAKIERGEPAAVVYMTVWENRTNELGLENLIFRQTADWLQQSRHLRITRDRSQADYILTGTILSVDYPATAFSITDVASTLKAKIRTSYQLTERSTGKTVWRVEETLRQADYPAGGNAVRSQGNKKTALTTIADELGEQIYLRITETLTAINFLK